MPGGQVPRCATVALPDAPSVAGAPLTVSLAATLVMGCEPTPASAVPASATGLIDGAITVTVSVVLWQSAGTFQSQR